MLEEKYEESFQGSVYLIQDFADALIEKNWGLAYDMLSLPEAEVWGEDGLLKAMEELGTVGDVSYDTDRIAVDEMDGWFSKAVNEIAWTKILLKDQLYIYNLEARTVVTPEGLRLSKVKLGNVTD